jgi:hypothetical protein
MRENILGTGCTRMARWQTREEAVRAQRYLKEYCAMDCEVRKCVCGTWHTWLKKEQDAHHS